MRIVADENIPLLDAFFAGFGEIRRLPGRSIDRAAVADADVLLVRSVTPVTREMLEGSPVRFVGTCTIGTDHLDLTYLQDAAIQWSSAPGCNARGVVDYVLGSLLTLAEIEGVDLRQRTYGVVGAGQVGGRLIAVLKALGWKVLVCDPPRQSAEGGNFVSLDEILQRCDVISLHTPLDKNGQSSTWHLLDEARLRQLRQGAWLINASRGAVVDNRALHDVMLEREDLQAVLDVWEGEPQVNVALADLCVIGTPHIAGYSLDGRQRGTAQIYQALCAFLDQPAAISLADLLPTPWLAQVSLDAATDPQWALNMLCRGVYDPRRDDADFRRSLTGDTASQRLAFDALRKHYPPRREIEGLKVYLEGESDALTQLIRALGAVRV
ncbi:4-phosphoerythronate dehydrogenase PdxB [Pseudomonas syringae pv. actinidiae]|uniref:Erythronate-4-phosphate dehydrogenase n=5 Tax=Pseudomonas syringae TaxID=317 RepID=A0A0K8M2F3_PSESF|nr:4-phosphoerythronate dehydrogenase PdxB [Pseudomonas syringae]AKT29907.1 erythronate-4-phosphate dehydrogenase [Pseudomonas syringae pv. actinidiae ICMP 18884]AOE56361.1 erythronate-4-phosphate dehydrogenase [Pseudomonas syringae pv. actinidiae ICMP 18708]APP97324.1 4-phosphoerythronate dehydrogenase [Pseudomonas syringae pv. actinidiae]APQ03074.1 4-phosphoerythronate dehydrogenase [Pseudomonas syringae pv. actinidiae]AQL38394.1 4-phosphoerythronate dehydrogenase [Pseudomonas syringae pv. a